MKKSNFALRLQPSLMDELRKVAEAEGVPLNQFINVAVAEKLSAIRTEEFFRERAQRANLSKAFEFLARIGEGNPVIPGDELPPEYQESRKSKPPRKANVVASRSRKKRRA